MSLRLRSHLNTRLDAWLNDRANDLLIKRLHHTNEAFEAASDAYGIEQDKVRALQSHLADRAEAIEALNEEIAQMQIELSALYRAHRRLEMENDALRGDLAGTSVADEVEAFLAHPSQEGDK